MSGETGLVRVQLLGLPVQARIRFVQHLQDLTRELSLVRIGAENHPGTWLSPRLLEIASELNGTYAGVRAEPDAVVAAAIAAGEEFCDVTYTVPVSAGAFLKRLGEVLDEADDFCRGHSHLLSLPASQEVVAYRRWFVAESARQTAGEPPRPWRLQPWLTQHVEPAAVSAAAPPVRTDTAVVGGAGEVVGRPMVMESMASSVSAARRHVREVLRTLGAQDLEESAELGVSELVTNAVLHARTAFTLSVRRMDGDRVRIEVTDRSPGILQPRPVVVSATTGRGLQLVASLSWDWGVEELPPHLGPGKTVWFEPRAVVDDGTLGQDWDLDAFL